MAGKPSSKRAAGKRPSKGPVGKPSGKTDVDAPASPERIQKILARAGLGSRRQLEVAIKAGEIQINGKVAELGSSLHEGDRVEYVGRNYHVISSSPKQQTLLYNKPVGEITTNSDPEGRRTVFDRLPKPGHGRWIAIGRLDINTSGLLILTTDGELANAMMHPSSMVDREYACRVHGEVSAAQLQALRDGVELEDGMAKFSDIAVAGGGESNQWYQVTILEGRNREVRRLWATQGVEVSRLQRVRYGAAFLPKGLHRSKWHWLSDKDHRILREDVKLPRETPLLTLQFDRRGGGRPVRARPAKNVGTSKKRTTSKPRTGSGATQREGTLSVNRNERKKTSHSSKWPATGTSNKKRR